VAGFDATSHQLSDVTAAVTAKAFVDGRYSIGDHLWRAVVINFWDLQKIDGNWKVTRMEFSMPQEIDDRAAATLAT
jgi:hypothetical protein